MAKQKKPKRKAAPDALTELGRYKALAQMVGGFVHQLRTPIHIIQSSAGDLADRKSFPPEFKAQIDMIKRSAQRLDASVTSILNFAKGVKLTLQPGSLHETLQPLGDFLKEESQRRHVTIENRFASRLPVLLDTHHLQEALLNLLMNALQAMPEGGILTIATEDAPTGDMVRLEITDTGIGMDKKALKQIAVPFHTTKKQGMGLGLFFTRKILDQHHAELTFSSAKGRGTTATLIFPALQPQNP